MNEESKNVNKTTNEINSLENIFQAKVNTDNDNFTIREGLRESQFRRFEQFILDAIKYGSFNVKTSGAVTNLKGHFSSMTAKTFCTKFTDALLAQRRFEYSIEIKSSGFQLANLKCKPVGEYECRIVNRLKDTQLAEATKLLCVGNWDYLVLKLRELDLASGEAMTTDEEHMSETTKKILSSKTYVSFASQSEYAKLENFLNDPANGFNHISAKESSPNLALVI